jgi:hypothetical protein
MGIAEAAEAITSAIAAKVADGAVLADPAVIEVPPVAADFPELDMVPDLLCNGGWIFAKLAGNAFKGFLCQQPLFDDDSLGMGQMFASVHRYTSWKSPFPLP